MGSFLMGKERSGTPMETRKGTKQLADAFSSGDMEAISSMMAPFSRMGAQGFQELYGFDPSQMDLGGVMRDLLVSPADATSGLFASMRPFEERETAQQVAGMRNIFGTMGGRFGKNVATAEGQLRGELGGQFARSREEALLAAAGQRASNLFNLMGLQGEAGQQGLQGMQALMQFFQPGAPYWQEGALPGLLSAAANVYGMSQFGKWGGQQPGGQPGGPQVPGWAPSQIPPSGPQPGQLPAPGSWQPNR